MSQTALLIWNFKTQKDFYPLDIGGKTWDPFAQEHSSNSNPYPVPSSPPCSTGIVHEGQPKTKKPPKFPKTEAAARVPAPDCSLQRYLLGQLQFLFHILELVPIFRHFRVGCAQLFLQRFHLWTLSLWGEEWTPWEQNPQGKTEVINIHGSIRTTELVFSGLIFWGIEGNLVPKLVTGTHPCSTKELSISCWFPHFNHNSYQVSFQNFQRWSFDSCSITTKGMDFFCGCL